MRKLTLCLSLVAVLIAVVGAAIAVAAFLNHKKDEDDYDYDDSDLLMDDELDYYEAQVEEDNGLLQEIVDDTHPQEHGAVQED